MYERDRAADMEDECYGTRNESFVLNNREYRFSFDGHTSAKSSPKVQSS